MRNFNHIILDFESHNSINTSKYWASKTLSLGNNLVFLNNIDMVSKFSNTNQAKEYSSISNKMTVRYSNISNDYNAVSYNTSNLYHLYSDTTLDLTNFRDNKSYREYILSKSSLSTNLILEQKVATLLSNSLHSSNIFSSSNNIVNINFLRRERLYTKLKYSRSPAYDIVSGGSAALLAAFVGFLISEKYGFEMVDSGDFYFLFMYLVFISFSVRPLLITLNSNNPVSSVFTIKPIINFFLNIIYLMLNKFKR